MISTVPKVPQQQASVAEAHLSASQVSRFSQCSLQWFLSRKFPPAHVSSSLRFGGTIHRGLQTFYQGRLEGRDVTQAEMLAAYEGAWAEETKRYPDTPVQFSKGETEESLRELASRMLTAFLANVKPGQIIAVEEPVQVRLCEDLPMFSAVIDLVELCSEGDSHKLWIVDHKTAGKRPTEKSGPDEDQLVWYGLCAAKKGLLKSFGSASLGLRYDVLTKTKSAELISVPVQPSRHQAVQLIEKAKMVWKAMQAQIVYPQSGWWCSGCAWEKPCAKWPQT